MKILRSSLAFCVFSLCASFTGKSDGALITLPPTILPGDILYRLDAANEVVASGGFVSSWGDVQDADAFTQATAVKQPTFLSTVAGKFNNNPVIRFDGDLNGNTGGVAINADELIFASSTNVQTFIAVNQTTQHRNLDGIWGAEGADTGVRRKDSSSWQASSNGGNNNDFDFTGGATFVNGFLTPNAATNTPHVLTVVSPSLRTFGTTSIGDYFQAGTNTPRSWAGDIGEILVFNRALTSSERFSIETQLGLKFGIAVVPEPTRAASLVLGLSLVMLRRRRKLA